MENLEESYTFLAIFHNDGELGYSIKFPNFDECFTYSDTFEHGLLLAKDILEFYVYGRVEADESLPVPLTVNDVELIDMNDKAIEITVNMNNFKESMKKNPIDREEHIPSWLTHIAKKNKENLGDALESLILTIEKDLEDN
ncbi:type II toxin-antitoxin system HicB family antitoxin [uncultured Clostridium sp.]|jgi:predicted RNase H-like HicB family nuclease|uniref:type II toxin-antitoxin system HicB family antitoxin n=1 Tax=uncultured Clostridium sp. TaxID=59620 RepID=UPI002637C6AD|nr:type II toxin-antitoxin system HicB family antitoxin [uncultured Clostridium sp.]